NLEKIIKYDARNDDTQFEMNNKINNNINSINIIDENENGNNNDLFMSNSIEYSTSEKYKINTNAYKYYNKKIQKYNQYNILNIDNIKLKNGIAPYINYR